MKPLCKWHLDCSGRPHISYGLTIPTQKIGTYDTELVKEFFVAVANNSGLTLHHSPAGWCEFPPHRGSLFQSLRPCAAHGYRN